MMPWAAAVAARAAAARAAAEAAAEAAVLAADAWAAWSEANAEANALADAWAAWAAEANAWSEVDAEVFAWGAWVKSTALADAAESTARASANLGEIMTTHLPPDPRPRGDRPRCLRAGQRGSELPVGVRKRSAPSRS